jgi:rhodanese-related sulfurtransferase
MRSGCQWLAGMLLCVGCAGAPGERSARPSEADSASVQAVNPAAPESRIGRMEAPAARAFLASHPEALVLDVRNPDEWDDAYGHIEGARQIPLPELSARLSEVEAWKDKPIVTVCRAGPRSQAAAELLASLGYRRVFNLEGGMIAWRESEGAPR